MADIESLSFFLLIPFSICFVLVFLVCCFADKLKAICRFPTQIPASYSPVTSYRRRRPRGRFRTTSGSYDIDDMRILTRNQERSQNTSESSVEPGPGGWSAVHENGRLVIQQGHLVCPQTALENGQVVHGSSQTIPHRIFMPQTTHMTSHTFSSSPSFIRTNLPNTSSFTRNSCFLPAICERVEHKNSAKDVSCSNFPSDVNSDANANEQHRNIRNLPEVITFDLISEKK